MTRAGIRCFVLAPTKIVRSTQQKRQKTDEKDVTTQQSTFWVKPWCFSLWIMMMVLWASWKCGKFAFKRFFINPRPPEKIIKKKEEFK